MNNYKKINFTIRPLTAQEEHYVFAQDEEIQKQSGLIGYLRADHDTDGYAFFSTWFGFNDDLKVQEFKDELDDVINMLRFGEDNPFLKNRTEMERYCRSHPETKLSLQGWSKKDHGVRIDTQEYAYLMRLIPVKGDYNLYCYCHKRDMLDKHLGIPEKHEDEKVLDATGISNEMFLNEVCREYEAKLRELMGKKAFDEYVPEVSKKAFRKIVTKGMAEGSFKDFILENFDNITE